MASYLRAWRLYEACGDDTIKRQEHDPRYSSQLDERSVTVLGFALRKILIGIRRLSG